jgi:hypothetical protein
MQPYGEHKAAALATAAPDKVSVAPMGRNIDAG